jgi:hypothetical protein
VAVSTDVPGRLASGPVDRVIRRKAGEASSLGWSLSAVRACTVAVPLESGIEPCNGDVIPTIVPVESVLKRSNESVSVAVVRAVSAVVGRKPRHLKPLGHVLDPDAIDALFDSRANGEQRTGGRISFVFGGCSVAVENGEYVDVQPIEDG